MSDKWIDPSRYIRQIHVAEDVIDDPIVKNILIRAGLPYSIVPVGEEPKGIPGFFPDNLNAGKKHLFLCNNKGLFF